MTHQLYELHSAEESSEDCFDGVEAAVVVDEALVEGVGGSAGVVDVVFVGGDSGVVVVGHGGPPDCVDGGLRLTAGGYSPTDPSHVQYLDIAGSVRSVSLAAGAA